MQTRMQSAIPETANFMRQVELGNNLSGSIPVSRFERLGEMLASQQGEVQVRLSFGVNAGYAGIKGNLTADLQLECQRCLQPMEIKVVSSFKFAFVDNEDEIELLPEEFEPFLIEGEEQSVIDLIEDELILSLPMVAAHENACSEYMQQHEQQVKADKEAAHPFAALKALKGNLDDKVN
jgi:uncharacterized protein